MDKINAWIDRDNISYIQLSKQGTVLTSDEIDAITKVEIRFGGEYFSSEDYPECFDLVTLKDEGKIGIRPGLLPIDTTLGFDVTELIIYDGSHTNGVLWMQFVLVVKKDVEIIEP